MPISFHPQQGTILICDFRGYESPEMMKRRPVIVISPKLRSRPNLCSVVPMSTTAPHTEESYHYRLETVPPLPAPYSSDWHWVKADMVYTVGFDRLFLAACGKDDKGVRLYDQRVIAQVDLQNIQRAILHGIGLGRLTEHL
jgi:mRNA interferase MazF